MTAFITPPQAYFDVAEATSTDTVGAPKRVEVRDDGSILFIDAKFPKMESALLRSLLLKSKGRFVITVPVSPVPQTESSANRHLETLREAGDLEAPPNDTAIRLAKDLMSALADVQPSRIVADPDGGLGIYFFVPNHAGYLLVSCTNEGELVTTESAPERPIAVRTHRDVFECVDAVSEFLR